MKIQSIIIAAAVLGVGGAAWGQGVPFFNAGAIANGAAIAAPVIQVAQSGVEINVLKATVTADRRYVTMDLDPQLPTVKGFKSFTFESAGGGFVGGAGGGGGGAAGGVAKTPVAAGTKTTTLTPSIKTSPAEIGATGAVSILDKPGMTLIAAIKQ